MDRDSSHYLTVNRVPTSKGPQRHSLVDAKGSAMTYLYFFLIIKARSSIMLREQDNLSLLSGIKSLVSKLLSLIINMLKSDTLVHDA